MRNYLLVLLAAYFGSAEGYSQFVPAAAAPRLVLVISIDQMRYDYLDRFEPLYKQGLRQVIDKGAIFNQCQLSARGD